VDAWLASLPAGEVVERLASLELDPLEEDRADVRHALLMEMLMHLLWRGKKKPGLVAKDFLEALPWRNPPAPPKPMTQGELNRKVDAVMMMLGGKKS
jgi:hypothetical protein